MKWKIATILLLSLILVMPVVAAAKVNINTASAEELDSLPGVGPAIAARIIAARPFATIEDITRVQGIGEVGSASYNKIKDLITVGDDDSGDDGTTGGDDNSSDDSSDNNSGDTSGGANDGSLSAHSDPSELSDFSAGTSFKLSAGRKRLVAVGSPVNFRATLNNSVGKVRVDWSFGDGAQKSGAEVDHTYYAPGIYNVVVNGSLEGESAVARTQVEVFAPQVAIAEIIADGIKIKNDGNQEINLGGWKLIAASQAFVIPDDTIIAAKSAVVIPSAISRLALAGATTVVLQSPIAQIVAQADSPIVRQEKILALQKKLAEASSQLAKLKVSQKAPIVWARATTIAASTTPPPISTSETSSSSVVELPAQSNWWGKLINKVLP